jgi:hypothetical protein
MEPDEENSRRNFLFAAAAMAAGTGALLLAGPLIAKAGENKKEALEKPFSTYDLARFTPKL